MFSVHFRSEIPTLNTDNAAPYGRALNRLKEEGKCPTHVEHRQIKFHKSVIECELEN